MTDQDRHLKNRSEVGRAGLEPATNGVEGHRQPFEADRVQDVTSAGVNHRPKRVDERLGVVEAALFGSSARACAPDPQSVQALGSVRADP